MIFLVLCVVLVGVTAAVVANARARRRLEALHEEPRDQRRVGDDGQPPSSSGYRGSAD